ncbi:hypothetical protein IAT38_000964 [Cryptococcus sp. DSM 104549]
MGIKGLTQWVKKAHPDLVVSYPKRWASPELRGKRVAIDATLITNRFHFAGSRAKEGRDPDDSQSKEAIGWYNMITEMRAQGVKPIAIWDQRGVRDWKAAEARRRLMTRAVHLARRNHEITRSSRLVFLRQALQNFDALPEDEKKEVRKHWRDPNFMFVQVDGAPLPDVGAEDQLPTPPPTPPAAVDDFGDPISDPNISVEDRESRARIEETIDDLSYIVESFRHSYRPSTAGVGPSDILPGINLSPELSELGEELTRWTSPRSEMPGLDEQQKRVEELDKKLESSLPMEEFTETRRQMELTREEGKIISAVLASPVVDDTPPTSPLPPPTSPLAPPASPLAPPTSSLAPLTPPPTPPLDSLPPLSDIPDTSDISPLERLDALIEIAPEARRTHERALDMPTKADHEDCKELLEKMGVPVIEAEIPYEAEGLASAMAKKGLVDFVGTEDSDVLGYEAPLLRNLTSSKQPLTVLSGASLRERTGLSPSSYLDFLVLLGTDAAPNIPKVGPVTAFRLIQQHGSIEKIIEERDDLRERITDVGEWMESVQNAQRLFTDLPPVSEDWDLENKETDQAEVERYLQEKHQITFVERPLQGGVVNVAELDPTESEYGGYDDESGGEQEVDWEQVLNERGGKQ